MSMFWTEDETHRLIELWNSGAKVLEISYLLGRTERSVAHQIRVCRDKGLIPTRNRRAVWSAALDSKIIRQWHEGLPGSKIAESIGLTPRQVWNRLVKLRGTVGNIETRYKSHRMCSFADVRAAVLTEYNISMTDITSARRTKEVIEPRQVLMCVGYKYSGLSLPQIGQRLRRDHTTVLHACKIAPVKYPQAVATIEAKLLHREAAE